MKTIKTTIVFVMIFFLGNSIWSQDGGFESSTFETAFGVRAGGTSGFTIKRFVNEDMAIEAILGIWPYSVSGTAMLEFYAPSGAPGLNWYYGIGGHLSLETGRIYYAMNDERFVNREGELGLGADGIVGIEYKITPIPIALSFDLKPFIEVNTRGRAFMALDPGLGIKFAF